MEDVLEPKLTQHGFNVLNNSRVIYFPSTSWQKEFEIVKTRYTVTLAMTASFVLGALAAQALHAQATRPAYVVTIFDTEEVMKTNYPSLNPATFQPFGGHYIIHFGKMITFDGKPPNQIVVIAFDSIANAQAWRASGAFKETYDINKIANVRAFAVEGSQ